MCLREREKREKESKCMCVCMHVCVHVPVCVPVSAVPVPHTEASNDFRSQRARIDIGC